MIITISGSPGSGKSTVAKMVAEELGMKHHSVGDFMRDMAKKRGISLSELGKLAEKGPEVDEELDGMCAKLSKKDDFVVDGRLCFHFVPDSKKVFLDVDMDEGAKRVFNDLRPAEKENVTLEDTKESLKRRIESENKRYMEYYGVDIRDKSRFDLWIDTTKMTVEEVVDRITEEFK